MIEFTGANFRERRLVRRVEKAVYSVLGQRDIFTVDLAVTDGATVRAYNRETRGVDAETDVLSFPMLEYDRPGDFSHAEEDESCFNPDTGELILGDIMISVPKLKEQAEAYGHSQLREYAFLIAHSLLHLMGYDHMEPEEAALMESRQREILEDLGITR